MFCYYCKKEIKPLEYFHKYSPNGIHNKTDNDIYVHSVKCTQNYIKTQLSSMYGKFIDQEGRD